MGILPSRMSGMWDRAAVRFSQVSDLLATNYVFDLFSDPAKQVEKPFHVLWHKMNFSP